MLHVNTQKITTSVYFPLSCQPKTNLFQLLFWSCINAFFGEHISCTVRWKLIWKQLRKRRIMQIIPTPIYYQWEIEREREIDRERTLKCLNNTLFNLVNMYIEISISHLLYSLIPICCIFFYEFYHRISTR